MYLSQVIINITIMIIPAYTVLQIPQDYTERNSDVAYIKGASECFSMSRHFQSLIRSSTLLPWFLTSYNAVSQCQGRFLGILSLQTFDIHLSFLAI